MKFTFEGKEYKIWFGYPHESIITDCWIEPRLSPGNGTTQNTEVAIGRAVCHAKDNFAREIGRKLALKRALLCAGAPREFRTAAWKAYLGRKTRTVGA